MSGEPRFSRNDLLYCIGLILLFTGLTLRSYSLALIVIGAILTSVSIATSFFVTWLSASKEK